ncbi:MAG: TIM barrel protein [Candidatus Lokiarchaeota archaeon]|nr:TIM barrel protein [Candidatus Lokiarchaeota archaeon]MBD3202135.1 TIM barrel protein [Candidatus Lokiarchaeota archaeon]
MRLKFCCAWLYAISKYNKYGESFKIQDILEALEDIKKLGFQATELEAMRRKNLEEELKHKKLILEKLETLELKVNNLCAIFPGLISEDWEHHIGLFEKTAGLANYLGCETIQVDSHMPPLKYISERPYDDSIKFNVDIKIQVEQGKYSFNWNSHWSNIVNSIKKCDEIAIDHGLKLCLEPRVHESIPNTDSILRLFDWVDSDNFGAVLDCGHLHAQKELIPLSVEKLSNKIFFVHASDNDGRKNDHLGVGRGNIDWEGTLKALKKHNFDGYIAIDIGNLPSPYNLEDEIIHSMKYLRKLYSP